MAPTENIYNTVETIPYYGPPGVGLNAGVIMMNLTRMRYMAGGGFTGSIRCSTVNRLCDSKIANLFISDGSITNTRKTCSWLIRIYSMLSLGPVHGA